MGILQASILEWVAMLSSRRSSQPKDRAQVSCMQADSLSAEPPGKQQVRNICRNLGLNQGPLDLQSNALPTELFLPPVHRSIHNAIYRFWDWDVDIFGELYICHTS